MYYHLILTDNCNLCCTYCRGKAFTVEPPEQPDIVIDEDLPVDLDIDLADLYRFLAKDPDAVLTFYGGGTPCSLSTASARSPATPPRSRR